MTATMRPAIDVHDQRVWELTPQEALIAADVDARTGLSATEAEARLERWGPNALPPVRAHGPLMRFLLQFHNPPIYVLLVSAVAAALIGEQVDAAVIVTVLVVNALVGFVQESHAEGALAALAAMTETTSTVVRDGDRRPVPSRTVVPGDLVVLEAGDKVPADLRLVESHELRVDESALTGESAPAAKDTRRSPADTPLADRENMAHSGTLVTSGSGAGVVTATGARTEFGVIHGLMRRTAARQPPLPRKIAKFSRVVTVAVLVLGAGTFAIGVARGQSAAEML